MECAQLVGVLLNTTALITSGCTGKPEEEESNSGRRTEDDFSFIGSDHNSNGPEAAFSTDTHPGPDHMEQTSNNKIFY